MENKLFKLERFNDCYPKDVKAILDRYPSLVLADLDTPEWWHNCVDTLVIRMTETKPYLITELMIDLHELVPNELDAKYIDRKIYLRLWWD